MFTRLNQLAVLGLALCSFSPAPFRSNDRPLPPFHSTGRVSAIPDLPFQELAAQKQRSYELLALPPVIPKLPTFVVPSRRGNADRFEVARREPQDAAKPNIPVPQIPSFNPPSGPLIPSLQDRLNVFSPDVRQPDAPIPFPGKGEPAAPSELGAQWDRRVRELEAKDAEIKQLEQQLAQLRKERRDIAHSLADVARKLGPLVEKARTEGMPPPPPPSPKQPDGKANAILTPPESGSKTEAPKRESTQIKGNDLEKRPQKSGSDSHPTIDEDEDPFIQKAPIRSIPPNR